MSEFSRRSFLGASLALLATGCSQAPREPQTPRKDQPLIVPAVPKSNPVDSLIIQNPIQALPTPNPDIVVKVGPEIKRPEIKEIVYEVGRPEKPVFHTNGIVLSTSEKTLVMAQKEVISAMLHDPDLIILPPNFIIATVFDDIPLNERSFENVRSQIPFSQIATHLKERFPHLKENPKYSISTLSIRQINLQTNEVIESIPLKPRTVEELYLITSAIASRQWFIALREQFALNQGQPIPPRAITSKQMNILSNLLPIRFHPENENVFRSQD